MTPCVVGVCPKEPAIQSTRCPPKVPARINQLCARRITQLSSIYRPRIVDNWFRGQPRVIWDAHLGPHRVGTKVQRGHRFYFPFSLPKQ